MPVIVDHARRRLGVAEIAARLIVESGLDAVTFRDIAREAGYSTSVVSHYFRNKRDLLLFVYRMVTERAVEDVKAALASGADLQTCLEALLPVNEGRRANWRIWFAFWSMTSTDEELLAEQQRRGREARQLIERVLRMTSASRRKHLTDEDLEMQSRRLLATVVGLATQGVHDPEDWPAERLRAVLLREIATL